MQEVFDDDKPVGPFWHLKSNVAVGRLIDGGDSAPRVAEHEQPPNRDEDGLEATFLGKLSRTEKAGGTGNGGMG